MGDMLEKVKKGETVYVIEHVHLARRGRYTEVASAGPKWVTTTCGCRVARQSGRGHDADKRVVSVYPTEQAYLDDDACRMLRTRVLNALTPPWGRTFTRKQMESAARALGISTEDLP